MDNRCINKHTGHPKARYLTRSAAKRAVKQQAHLHTEKKHPYACSNCGFWHIGRYVDPELLTDPKINDKLTNKKRRKAVNEQRFNTRK